MKVSGLALLMLGLILIGWILYASYNIFTDRAAAPDIFSVFMVESEEMTEEEMTEAQLKEVFPIEADALPKILNLIAWSVLAFILVFGGSQIAGLGIKLMK